MSTPPGDTTTGAAVNTPHKRFPLSDGMRGIAALAVLFAHVWAFSGGFGGYSDTLPNRMAVRLDGVVALFFLLSTLLLYRPMIAHRTGGPPGPRTSSYAIRRFLRIYPVYWVILTVLAIVPGLIGVFTSHWSAFYSLTEYLFPYRGSDCTANAFFICGLPQTWNLTVELTFYIVLPFYALFTAWLARGRDPRTLMRLELGILAVLAFISVACDAVPSIHSERWFKYTFLGHFYWLSLGLALAVLSVHFASRESLPKPLKAMAVRPGACWAAAIGIYALTVATMPPQPFPVAPAGLQFAALNLAQGAMAALLLIPVVFSDPNHGLPSKVAGNRFILWVGAISYSFYLWHVTIAYQLGIGGAKASFGMVLFLTLLLTFALSTISFYAVERPMMKLRYRRRR